MRTRMLPASGMAMALLAAGLSAASAETDDGIRWLRLETQLRSLPQTEPGLPATPSEAAEGSLLRRRRELGAAPPPAPQPDAVVQRPRLMDSRVRQAPLRREQFGPDPTYADTPYDAAAQFEIYGGKRALSTPRPLLELGYPLYSAGPLGATHTWFGAKNLLRPQFLVYGDFRAAHGANEDAIERSLIVARLNLALDLKLTGTERLHVLLRPLDRDGQFSRIQFDGANTPDGREEELELNAEPVTAFFEGDLGQIWQGISGAYNHRDIPIAAGLVPLLLQNGVWLDDAFNGFAITLPARNSAALDISNYDITFFAGFDEVSSAAIQSEGKIEQHNATLYGLAGFVERKEIYYELDYGYTQDDSKEAAFDRSYHNVSIAATRRFGATLSHSTRLIHNFGQNAGPDSLRTADGTALLLENSFMTRRPYTLLPYLNLFYGDERPQSLARDAGAGGLLKNVGLNFETDNLTGFPKLDDTAANAYGGAFGLQYLFNLDRQIVIEIAALDRHGDDADLGSEHALGLRFQQPFARQWIFRADAIVGDREQGDDLWGARVELRCKF